MKRIVKKAQKLIKQYDWQRDKRKKEQQERCGKKEVEDTVKAVNS